MCPEPIPDSQKKQSRRTFSQLLLGSAVSSFVALNGLNSTEIPGNKRSIKKNWYSLPYFGNNPHKYPFQLKLPYLIQNESEAERTQRRPVPLVVLFGGNGMGSVRKSTQADALAHALLKKGVATLVMPYPALVSGAIFQEAIIGRLHELIDSNTVDELKIDLSRIAFAGFSAGGLIATLLATKYAERLKIRPRAAVNYYGPVDLRLWFAFHQQRSATQSWPEALTGRRDAAETGFSAGGPVRCSTLSRQVIDRVEENVGGLRPGLLAHFSQDELWHTGQMKTGLPFHAPVLGVFGLNDDNCDAYFQARLMRQLGQMSQARHEYRFYNGPHGMDWDCCPESLDWLLTKLDN